MSITSTLRVVRRAALISFLAFTFTSPACALAVGDPAPGFALLDSTGELVSLDRLRGRVIYVDFWASWCGPCRRSFPWMNELRRRYLDQGLTIVGINVDKKKTDAERFLLQTPASFTILYDAAGATPNTWGVRAMPSSYLIDRQGRVVAVEAGFTEERAAGMEERIRKLLESK